MDIITTNLYGSINNDIYIYIYIYIYICKSLKDLNCLNQTIQCLVAYTQSSYNDALYGLK